ncbi:hypothetical protein Hanom_Chr16g01436791 [Helianthus anomalus]
MSIFEEETYFLNILPLLFQFKWLLHSHRRTLNRNITRSLQNCFQLEPPLQKINVENRIPRSPFIVLMLFGTHCYMYY